MTERELERLRIVNQLIGNIEGVGESNSDKKALSNINFANMVLGSAIYTIVKNARYEGFEASRIEIKERSETIIKGIMEIIERR